MLTAVRQTPLTAMLSPWLNSFASFREETVIRRLPFSLAMLSMRPTSSMMPVNMTTYHTFEAGAGALKHFSVGSHGAYTSCKYPSTAKSSPKRCRRMDFT